jgi:predicted RNA-binding Zn-ribbon protein involved in translation (DUF1610 family)
MVSQQCQKNCTEIECPECGGVAKKIKPNLLDKLFKKKPLSNYYKCTKCGYIALIVF